MTRFAFTIEFDGRPYMGWQRQSHGPSVQQHVEEALGRIVGCTPVIHCAGRTDAGVHALAMRAHADIETSIAPFRLMAALNAQLRPEPIAAIACAIVADDWHARFSCLGRAYEYRILNRSAPLTFERGLVWRVPQPLDADAMHAAAQQLVGRHDFTTFRSAHCQADSPLRTLDRLDVVRVGDRLAIQAQARSFLHHQVRSMVGCLSLVGTGSWSVADMKAALDARDRAALGFNAPPDGLYFVHARYAGEAPGKGFVRWTHSLAVQETGGGDRYGLMSGVAPMDLESLKQEHAELITLRAELLRLIESDSRPAVAVAAIRWRLSRILLTHLAREDQHLYPHLKADPHRPTAELARRYEREMGDLAPRWQAYLADWTSSRIAREWAEFAAVTRAVMNLLAQRIECEERDLYPLFMARSGCKNASSAVEPSATPERSPVAGRQASRIGAQ